MINRIICIGNSLVETDSAGIEVYERLRLKAIPEHTELIEGGLAGLNLLSFLEDVSTVVFVDSVSGFTSPGEIVVLNEKEIKAELNDLQYGHAAGIPYLLALLPAVCEGELPDRVFLVGLEGRCSCDTVDRAANLAIAMVQK